ncbi:MAG: hypothetical protein V4857_26245 [Pseudomonadota bacterium]
MNDKEAKIIKIYDGSKPVEEDLYESNLINQLAWATVAVLSGLVIWLCIALVNAENQRNALRNNLCADPVFKGEVVQSCLAVVRSRDHWWEHLWYGLTHVRPEPK